jgi:hypothetical protein
LPTLDVDAIELEFVEVLTSPISPTKPLQGVKVAEDKL